MVKKENHWLKIPAALQYPFHSLIHLTRDHVSFGNYLDSGWPGLSMAAHEFTGRDGILNMAHLYVSRQLHTIETRVFLRTGPPDHPDHTTLVLDPATDDVRERLIWWPPTNITHRAQPYPRPFTGSSTTKSLLLGALCTLGGGIDIKNPPKLLSVDDAEIDRSALNAGNTHRK